MVFSGGVLIMTGMHLTAGRARLVWIWFPAELRLHLLPVLRLLPVRPSSFFRHGTATNPSGLSGIAVSSSEIDLTWTASVDNVGVTKYSIYENGFIVGTSNTTSYKDTGLIPSTAYTYAVTASDAAGNVSAKSTSITLTTLPSTKFSIGDRVETTTNLNVVPGHPRLILQ